MAEAPAPPPAEPEIPPVVLNGVTYTLDDWGWEGNSLVFWIKALNQKADTAILVYFETSLTDDRGDRHAVSLRMSGDRRGGFDAFEVPLPSEVPTRLGVLFAGMPPSVKTVPLLEIQLAGLGKVSFRNIPVAGRTLKTNK